MKIQSETMRLYAVTLPGQDEEKLMADVARVIQGGAGIVQLREKNIDDAALIHRAERFVKICREAGAVSIINDRADVAARVNADGVHLGQADLDAGRAREILGKDKIMGVSAHNVEEALRAQAAGADYLGVGAAFSTGTKADARPIDHEIYREITRAVHIPVVAIGGIDFKNILRLKGLGLSGVAVVSALFKAEDAARAAREMRALAEML